MKIAFIRTKVKSTVFLEEKGINGKPDKASLERMKISPKAGSSSKNIMFGLMEYQLIDACEEWKLWGGPLQEISFPGQLSVKLFPCNNELVSDKLEKYLHETGQPDILWIEGWDYPPYIEQIIKLCPDSLKMVYSKDWRPWKIKSLEKYDLCLVDEEWEVQKVKKHFPEIHCATWDKLIDYEKTHYPITGEKRYDICYNAYLRERKNHELLFHAMAKVKDKNLKCVCIGDGKSERRENLQKLTKSLNISVDFVGEVSKNDVNNYINQSKIGVMCTKADAAPRAIFEYMAADVPVLVNSELLAGARYVGPEAGLVKSPDDFHLGITELLDNYEKYSPRSCYLKDYSVEKIIPRFIDILKQSGCQLNTAEMDF